VTPNSGLSSSQTTPRPHGMRDSGQEVLLRLRPPHVHTMLDKSKKYCFPVKSQSHTETAKTLSHHQYVIVFRNIDFAEPHSGARHLQAILSNSGGRKYSCSVFVVRIEQDCRGLTSLVERFYENTTGTV